MEGNKFTRKTKIILGIGFAIAIFGIMLIGVVPDLGAMVCGISLGLTVLYLFIVAIKAQAKSQELGKFLTIMGISFGSVGLAIAISLYMDLGGTAAAVMGIVFWIIGFIIFAKIENSACPKCGKRLSMKEIDRKIVGEYETTMNVEQEIRNKKGEKTGTYTQTVPAVRYVFDCTLECKFCGHTMIVQKENTYRK